MNLIDSLRKELKEEKEKSQKLAARNHDLEAQLIQWKENMRTGKLVRKRKRRRVIGKGSCYVYPKGDKYALQARSNGEQMCVKMFNTEAEVLLKKLITEGGSHLDAVWLRYLELSCLHSLYCNYCYHLVI